jgi:hypothetical protein
MPRAVAINLVEVMGQGTKGVGVALEQEEIPLLVWAELGVEAMLTFSFQFPEEIADGVFAGMTEGRVANIMGQAAGGDNGWQFVFVEFPKILTQPGIFIAQDIPYRLAQRAPDGGHFQAMGEAVVDEDGPGKREDLGLVLQAAEGRRKNDTVVVP